MSQVGNVLQGRSGQEGRPGTRICKRQVMYVRHAGQPSWGAKASIYGASRSSSGEIKGTVSPD